MLFRSVQRNGHATNAELGEQAGLSASQASRRVQRLQEVGVISGYTALLDPAALGLGVTAYAQVLLERHDKSRPQDFEKQVAAIPEVLECFAVTGEADYVLRIVAPDLAAFSDLMTKKLLTLPGVAQVKTSIALSKIKATHEMPLSHISRPPQKARRVRYTG